MVGACFFAPFTHNTSGIQKLNFSVRIEISILSLFGFIEGAVRWFPLLNSFIYCSEALALPFSKPFLHPLPQHHQTAFSSLLNASLFTLSLALHPSLQRLWLNSLFFFPFVFLPFNLYFQVQCCAPCGHNKHVLIDCFIYLIFMASLLSRVPPAFIVINSITLKCSSVAAVITVGFLGWQERGVKRLHIIESLMRGPRGHSAFL